LEPPLDDAARGEGIAGVFGGEETLIVSETPDVAFPWLAAYSADVPARVGAPPYRLLGDIAGDLAARRPAARAFTTILPNGRAASLSFAQVDRYSDEFAAFLRETLCLEPGTRVAIQIPNGLAYPVVAFGIFKAGCVLVNINPLYTAPEMAHLFADAEPAAIIAPTRSLTSSLRR
jgi:long-chain acyl-CoA synthetase